MLQAAGWQGLVFIDTIGHCAGAVLFGLLIVLLLRDSNFRPTPRNRLSLIAALLVFFWNIAELIVLQAGVPLGSRYRFAVYLSFCCLSILPAVLLHISLRPRLRSVAMAGYGISLISILSQYPGRAPLEAARSQFSLLLLTFGFALLSLGVWLPSEFLARRRGDTDSPNRVAFLALFILATSYFHFQTGHTSTLWVGEAIWRHASIPIALLVLLRDYRFFLLDVFLRFTVSACWIALWVWAWYSLNAYYRLDALALSSQFHRGLAVTAVCILLYLLARSLQYVQLVFTRVAFRRPPLDPLASALQNLSGENESELLEAASAVVARNYKCSRWKLDAELAAGAVPETGPIVVEPASKSRSEIPDWAILCLSMRSVQGSGSRLFLGPRAGGRRFLHEDLLDLQKVCAILVERVERFRNDELGRLVGQAELRALQAQINPHFLFNALNTLYGTIGRGSPQARQLVLNLAELFRARLQTNRAYLPLREELELVRAYLEIEGLRLGSRLQSEIEVDAGLSEAPVPVLAIQPLVENAIRHGVDRAGNVRMKLAVHSSGAGLTVVVKDSGPGFSAEPASTGTGCGLENVRKRLRLCYGESSRLVIESDRTGATVWFSIPTLSLPVSPSIPEFTAPALAGQRRA